MGEYGRGSLVFMAHIKDKHSYSDDVYQPVCELIRQKIGELVPVKAAGKKEEQAEKMLSTGVKPWPDNPYTGPRGRAIRMIVEAFDKDRKGEPLFAREDDIIGQKKKIKDPDFPNERLKGFVKLPKKLELDIKNFLSYKKESFSENYLNRFSRQLAEHLMQYKDEIVKKIEHAQDPERTEGKLIEIEKRSVIQTEKNKNENNISEGKTGETGRSF